MGDRLGEATVYEEPEKYWLVLGMGGMVYEGVGVSRVYSAQLISFILLSLGQLD